jgi:hypothetical protein
MISRTVIFLRNPLLRCKPVLQVFHVENSILFQHLFENRLQKKLVETEWMGLRLELTAAPVLFLRRWSSVWSDVCNAGRRAGFCLGPCFPAPSLLEREKEQSSQTFCNIHLLWGAFISTLWYYVQSKLYLHISSFSVPVHSNIQPNSSLAYVCEK